MADIASQLELREQMGDKPGAADAMGHTTALAEGSSAITEIYRIMADAKAEEQRLLAERMETSSILQKNMRMVLTIGGVICILFSSVVVLLLVRSLLMPLNSLTSVIGRIAAGEHSARATVLSSDELGQVTTEFNRMAQAIQDGLANELAATAMLKSKVDSLLAVVSKAAAGDLTGKIEVTGDDAIGQLASRA